MKVFHVVFLAFSSIISIECAKDYRFLSIESCTSDNELVATMTKCEVDGIYLTIIIDVKKPVTKLMMDVKMNLMNSENKIIFRDNLPVFDWCKMFGKDGKLPSSPGWKLVMKGFGKYLKDFRTCPIKKLALNRMHGDPKMMLFAPNMKCLFQLQMTAFTASGEKSFVNVSLIIEIFDK